MATETKPRLCTTTWATSSKKSTRSANSTIRRYEDTRHPYLETTVIDRRGFETHYDYDSRVEIVLKIEDARGVTRFEYDARNNVTRIIGPAAEDPGDGYADTIVDFFFAAGEITGQTVDKEIAGQELEILESPDVILGPEYDRNVETPGDSHDRPPLRGRLCHCGV